MGLHSTCLCTCTNRVTLTYVNKILKWVDINEKWDCRVKETNEELKHHHYRTNKWCRTSNELNRGGWKCNNDLEQNHEKKNQGKDMGKRQRLKQFG